MAPPHTMQLAGRADWALMIAIHDALRRDLDQLLHAAASHASARARWGTFRSQLRFHLAAEHAAMWPRVRAELADDPRGRALLDAMDDEYRLLGPLQVITEPALWALVIRHAQCSDGRLDPDEWFPVSADPSRARQEAAAAIAICATCRATGAPHTVT